MRKTLIALFAWLICMQTANAAGYTCPSYKKYTGCAAGYYMTQTSSSTSCDTTPVVGNACRPCSLYGSEYTCAGGTACPVAPTRSCPSGQYWNGTACATCDENGKYCPGFSNVSNPSAGYGKYTCPSGYAESDCGRDSIYKCFTRTSAGYDNCKPANAYSGGGWYYYQGGDSSASASCHGCSYTISNCSEGYYLADNACHQCPSDYPLTDPRGSGYSDETSLGACWRECNANDVPNSTIRTGWKEQNGNNTCAATACSEGYYLSNGACVQCTGATYCTSSTQYNCPSGFTANTSAGKTSAFQCQMQTTAGYAVENGATTQTLCDAGYYCWSDLVNYGSHGSWAKCPDGYTSAAGASSIGQCYKSCTRTCTQQSCPTGAYSCSHGSSSTSGTQYYNGSCNAATTTCTMAVNKCKNGYYLTDNACHSCPSDYPLTDPRNAEYSDETSLGTCWRECNANDVPNSTTRTGWKEQNGKNTCAATACNIGYGLTNNNNCAELCRSGITQMHIGNNTIISLYSAPQTTPAINIGYNNTVCYGNLSAGNESGQLNIRYDGKTYHTIK